jgi:hypothetical protein
VETNCLQKTETNQWHRSGGVSPVAVIGASCGWNTGRFWQNELICNNADKSMRQVPRHPPVRDCEYHHRGHCDSGGTKPNHAEPTVLAEQSQIDARAGLKPHFVKTRDRTHYGKGGRINMLRIPEFQWGRPSPIMRGDVAPVTARTRPALPLWRNKAKSMGRSAAAPWYKTLVNQCVNWLSCVTTKPVAA